MVMAPASEIYILERSDILEGMERGRERSRDCRETYIGQINYVDVYFPEVVVFFSIVSQICCQCSVPSQERYRDECCAFTCILPRQCIEEYRSGEREPRHWGIDKWEREREGGIPF
tara:strand:+ start:229 stop:576 length:348 start_codon:yes stop_codon:yes gene_type:complete